MSKIKDALMEVQDWHKKVDAITEHKQNITMEQLAALEAEYTLIQAKYGKRFVADVGAHVDDIDK